MVLAMEKEATIEYRVESKEWMLEFFSDVPTTDDRDQMDRLTEKHQAEIVIHKHLQKRNADWKRYRELVNANRIFMVMARRDGNVVGYIVLFVQFHLHDRALKYSMDDLYYIDPAVRGVGLGSRMIEMAENEARRRGSRLNLLRAKVGTPAAAFLEHIGYHPFETVYAKEL